MQSTKKATHNVGKFDVELIGHLVMDVVDINNNGLQINFVDLLVNLRGFMTSPKNLSLTDRITAVTKA